jgi:hypothetical protein
MDPGKGARRHRWAAAGVAAGLLVGAAAGVATFTGAAPEAPGPRPEVLHAAPALVRAGTAVDLTATTVCQVPDDDSCRITEAAAIVSPAGADGATRVPGRSDTGVLRFKVPAALVPAGGFSYSFELRLADGGRVSYPPGGQRSAIRVVTVQGLPTRTLASVDWDVRAEAASSIVLRPGDGPTQVGFDGHGEEGGVTGPSSFDIGPDGTIVVADHVNDRLLRFSQVGDPLGRVALPPIDAVDIAITGDAVLATTLGTDAEAIELSPQGEVVGRYPVGYGVTSRIVAGAVPRVRVGSAQWVPFRSSPGAALSSEAQSRGQTATVPQADGSVGVSELIGRDLALVWTRPDGSRAGAVIDLPAGVLAGADYFVRPLPDGGALAVQGLWDRAHFGVAALRLDASGRITSVTLLPEPSTRMAAPFSTVRFAAQGTVWMARDAGESMTLDRFDVR